MSVDKPRDQQRNCIRMKQHEAVAERASKKAPRHPLLDAFLRNRAEVSSPSGTSVLSGRSNSNRDSHIWVDDAFVRSTRPGPKQRIYGIIVDSAVDRNSDLNKALDSGSPMGFMRTESQEPGRTSEIMNRFREAGVSKYNWFPDEFREPALPKQPGILIDTEEAYLDQILRTALESTDREPIYLRAHPEYFHRKKKSSILIRNSDDSRIRFLSPDLSPAQCFSFCHTVIVGDSILGMEALIHEKRVVACGTQFFTGRGLTEDLSPLISPTPRRKLNLLELFETAYLRYCHYFDPDSGEPCGLGEIIDHIELQKEMFRRNRGRWLMFGFSPWNRSIASDYMISPGNRIEQATKLSEVPQDARVLLWGRKSEIEPHLRTRTIRVEDGFIRSRGLGAAFNFPYSWVIDQTGIYFDCSAPSDLENLYNHGFESTDLTKAGELVRMLREMRLTKYNLKATGIAFEKELAQGRKIILVPGQVDADASILFGSPEIKSNLELLRCVRANEPDAFIIFKAHPDLVAAARHGAILTHDIEAVADLVVTEGNVLDWLDQCDEVHTMTSTVGFEALIRNVTVVTYGLPFYAGWGLTKDRLTCERRRKKLTLEELVCGALMKYPRYLNPDTGEFTTAHKVVRLLASDKVAHDRRAWYLKAVSLLKKTWVGITRMRSPH